MALDEEQYLDDVGNRVIDVLAGGLKAMSEEIHIIPAQGQSAEEIAEVFTKVAEAQGLET